MDGSDNQEIEKPTVQILKKGFFETKKGKAIQLLGISIILFVILIIGLNYFDVISNPRLAFLPKKSATGTPVKITLVPENFGFKAGELTLGCPVESSFCQSQKLVNLQNIDSVAYTAASGSGVLNLTDIRSLENIAVSENKQSGRKYFYESTISTDGKSCYTIAYALPADATFNNIMNLEFLNQTRSLALLGAKTFRVGDGEANVIVQVRNTPMDAGKACSLLQKSPEFFTNF